jgi:hypothetical protein
MHHIIVRGATCPKQATMRLQVPVELYRMGDFRIDDGSRGAVARPISITLVLREEPEVMSLSKLSGNYQRGDRRLSFRFYRPDNNDRDGGFNAQGGASP